MIKLVVASSLFVIACSGGGSSVPEVCGDGLEDVDSEQCDDGNVTGGDGCSATCKEEVCGDGFLDVGEACDDGNFEDGDGCTTQCEMFEVVPRLEVVWRFQDLATSQTTGCPAGFDTAAIISQPIDAGGTPVGSQIIDLFDCDVQAGAISLPPDRYRVHVDIQNTASATSYAQSTSAIVQLGTISQTFDTVILNDGGYFALAWTLADAATNATLTCAQAGNVDSIEIVSTLNTTTTAVSDKFTCEDGAAITGGLVAGTYTISVAALNAANQALGAPQNASNKVIQGPNRITDLGTLTLPID